MMSWTITNAGEKMFDLLFLPRHLKMKSLVDSLSGEGFHR